MTIDSVLAWLHHLCFLGMAAALAMQWALLAPSRPGLPLAMLGRTDAWYGGLAGLLLVIGIARVVWGAKGPDFYLASPLFWAKMGLFAAVGAVSVLPTLHYLRWRRQAGRTEGFQPGEPEVAKVRIAIQLQALGWLALPLLAAAMARGLDR